MTPHAQNLWLTYYWKKHTIKVCVFLLIILISVIWCYAKITYNYATGVDLHITFSGNTLNYYYVYNPHIPKYNKIIFDREGFALNNVRGKFYRQPVTHANMALDHYHRHLETNSEEERTIFIKMAKILLNNGVVVNLGKQRCMVWCYDFQMLCTKPHVVPWISCLAQGKAISVLCRAYQLTNDIAFIKAAKLAVGPFYIPIENGGVMSTDADGNIYYEEYPFNNQSYPHVLNGFLFSLFGLYDLYRITGDSEAKLLFDKGVKTLRGKGVLQRYDLGYWTAYDQSPSRSLSFTYNSAHVLQLWALARITGDDYFNVVANRWLEYNEKHQYRIQFFFQTLIFHLKKLMFGCYRVA